MVRHVDQVRGIAPIQSGKLPQPADADHRDFRTVLDRSLKLSKHVCQRIGRRQLDLGPDKMRMLETAIDKAAAKGARESLVLLDNLTLLVSVENRTVITAMDKSSMKEGVFTQIDSAIII
jgi:flagellar operon protein